MKTREQNRNNKRTEIERFDWFIERIQTRVAFGWLSERSGEKTSCPRTFSKSIDNSLWRYATTRLANRTSLLHLRVLFGRKRKRPCFHPWADKTNNEHLPKPFFKVIRKLLYLPCKKIYYCRSTGWDFFSSPCFAFFESHKIIWKQTEYAVVFDSSLAVAVTSSQMLKKC